MGKFLKTILKILIILISISFTIVSFIFAGSSQENIFYIGCGFGLAAVLLFIIAIRPTAVKKNIEVKNEDSVKI